MEVEAPPQDAIEMETIPEVAFYFSAHSDAENFEAMRQEFAQADIYISEQHGWTPDDLAAVRAMAEGTNKPLHLREGRSAETAGDLEDELIYNSHKPIYFVDIPAGHELAEADDGQEDLQRAVNEFALNDFVEAEQSVIQSAKKNAEYLDKKDNFLKKLLVFPISYVLNMLNSNLTLLS